MLKKLKQWIAVRRAGPELLEALDQAHSEILWLLNYGDFKRKVVLDLGYIVDAKAKAKGEVVPIRDPYQEVEYESDDYETT